MQFEGSHFEATAEKLDEQSRAIIVTAHTSVLVETLDFMQWDKGGEM